MFTKSQHAAWHHVLGLCKLGEGETVIVLGAQGVDTRYRDIALQVGFQAYPTAVEDALLNKIPVLRAAFPDLDGERWYRTGDRARFEAAYFGCRRLLNALVLVGRMKLPARNKLLASMTDEVAELVLNDNYRQNQALSLMERMAVKRLGSKQHFIRTLEQQGLLDRQIEFLPSDAELSQRKARGQGLTRPELSVLLSYSKLVAFQQLLESDIPEDPYLSKELQRYFPQPLQKKYADAMERHRLKREIIATAVTNQTINRMGATFLMRMQEDTGRSIAEVAKAYTISRETLDARALWAQIDALDGQVPESVQVDALEVIWKLQRAFVRWLLFRPGPMPGITEAVNRYQGPFNDIRVASGVLPDAQRPTYEALVQQWVEKGLPAGLVGMILNVSLLVMTAMSITKEKEQGTMEFLLVTPIRPWEMIIGKIIPTFLVGVGQVIIILAIAFGLFKLPLTGDPLALTVLLLAYGITTLSVGILISTVALSQMQAMQLSFFYFLPSILLSGFMFPFSGMPTWAQFISQGLPLTYFVRGSRGVFLKEFSLIDMWPHLWPIMLAGLVFSLLAIKSYKKTLS